MPSTKANHVVVIEAPGKISRVAALFRERGETVLIAATKGHLYDLPVDRLAIDLKRFEAAEWEVRDPLQLERVRSALAQADQVTLMTDGDVEGEVIAAEVLPLIPTGVPVLRARLTALTSAALDAALADARPTLDQNRVSEGLARRITDRIIGYAFQDEDGPRAAIGRVLTPVLASLAREPACAGQIEVELADASSGSWRAVIPFTPATADRAEQFARELATLPRPAVQSVARTSRTLDLMPFTLGTAMHHLSERFGTTIGDVESTLQALYQQGRLTYPRTGSQQLTPETALHVGRIAARRGTPGFDANRLMQNPGRMHGAHEALAPTGAVALDVPIDSLPFEEKCLVAITERLIDAGQANELHTDQGQFVPSAASDVWREQLRRAPGPVYLVRQSRTQPPYARPDAWEGDRRLDQRGSPSWALHHTALFRHSPEHQALGRMLALGLGEPSTLGMISTALAERFLDQAGRVNGHGQRALALARAKVPTLFEPSTSLEMSKAFGEGGQSVPERVKAALGRLGRLPSSTAVAPRQTAPSRDGAAPSQPFTI